MSIQIGTDGLTFSVFNTVINKYIVLRHYHIDAAGADFSADAYEPFFENDDLLKLRYKNCFLLWISPRCTLVPEHLFDPSAAAAPVLNFNHGRKAGEQVLQNYIRSGKLYNIFSCPKALIDLFGKYRPAGGTFFHHATPFVDSVIAESMSSSKPRAAIYYYEDCMDITVVKSKKLLLYNTFHIKTPEDSVYYLAGALNLFDMNLATTKVFYAGNLKEMPPQAEIIKKYVERAVQCEPLETVTYSHYLTEALRTRYIHLFNLIGCVS